MTVARKKPETLRLRGIAPSITVDDIEESIRWYCDVVGFYAKERWESEGKLMAAELVAGSQSVLLMQDDWAKGRDRKKGEGLRLHLDTAQNVDDLAESIRERGGELASEPEEKPWGARSFDLVDPSGFKLTISQKVD